MCYKLGCTKFKANQFQPNCCLSLVIDWFESMHKGEENALTWCENANSHSQGSAFYSNHITNNMQLNDSENLKKMKVLGLVSQTMVKQVSTKLEQAGSASKQKDKDEFNSLTKDIKALAEDIHNVVEVTKEQTDLINKNFALKTYLLRKKIKVFNEVSENCMHSLFLEIDKLSDTPKYYLLRYKAKGASHAIGLVSMKRSGFLSPKGHIYYYDPNLKAVVQWKSRDDMKIFLKKAADDYKGLTLLRELRFNC